MIPEDTQYKVCFVVHKRFLSPLYEALAKRTQLLSSIADLSTPILSEEGYIRFIRTPVHAFGLHTLMQALRRETQSPLYVSRLGKYLKSTAPDALVVFDIYHWYTLQGLLYKIQHPNVKFFIWSESRFFPRNVFFAFAFRLFLGILRIASRNVDAVFVYTNEGERFMQKALPGVPIRIMMAPIDTEKFFPEVHKQFMPEGELRILMNARFVAYKRHGDILRALRILHDKQVPATLSLIGTEGHLKEIISNEAASLGLAETVTFLEKVPPEEILEVYRAHDVLVLPSLNEAIGMVVPEAMASGIPTVTSDTVGANLYVVSGETGYIYPTGDATALARDLERLANPEVLARFGAAARKRIEERFTPEHISEQFMSELVHD